LIAKQKPHHGGEATENAGAAMLQGMTFSQVGLTLTCKYILSILAEVQESVKLDYTICSNIRKNLILTVHER